MLKTAMEKSMKGKNLRAQTSLAWDYIETWVDGVHAYVYLHVCFSLMLLLELSLCGAGARAEVEAMHAWTSSIDVIHENKSKNESANIE